MLEITYYIVSVMAYILFLCLFRLFFLRLMLRLSFFCIIIFDYTSFF